MSEAGLMVGYRAEDSAPSQLEIEGVGGRDSLSCLYSS